MSEQTISVDELLSQQSRDIFKATIEPLEDDSMVSVTPYIIGRGCQCQFALRLSKSAIAGVTPSGETHICCGKTLLVVAISFAAGQSISITDVFKQLTANSSSPSHEPANSANLPYSSIPIPPMGSAFPENGLGIMHHERMLHANTAQCNHPYLPCGLNGCYNPITSCCCCGALGCSVVSNPLGYSCFNICR